MATTQQEAPMANGDDAESVPPAWSDLTSSVLEHIFDFILRAPMPHPEFLPGKLATWTALYRTCKQWRLAILNTGVGVCLPRHIDQRTQAWLRKCRIRGLELHDPDHTAEDTYSSLLSSPELLENSGEALQSIVDVPFNGKWCPSDFKQLSQLVTRRVQGSSLPPSFDLTAVASMKHLKVLVLGSGFNSLTNLDLLPDSCKTLVISCPGVPQDSYLQINSWPADKNIDWLSLSAHTMQLDLRQLQGHVRQLNIHTAYLFLEAPELAKANRLPDKERRAAADATLEEVMAGVMEDAALGELQLSCEVVMVGSRPSDEALNTRMLEGSVPVDIHEYYIDVCNHQVEAVLEAAAAAVSAQERENVELTCNHHGPELEVTLIRIKEGENNALALRLDLPGIDMEREVDKVLQQLADASAAAAAAGIKQHSEEQQQAGELLKPGIPSYRCVAFPAWSNLAREPDVVTAGYSVAAAVPTHASVSKAMPRGFEKGAGGRQKAESMASTSTPGSSSATPGAMVARALRQVQLQSRLLSSAAFIEGSATTLYEVTGLLLPPDPRAMRSLLNPFLNLSALFATTMEELSPHKDILPVVLQELHLTAGTPGQRFYSSAITNLTELRRVNLRGFSSYDLADMPAVRPGFGLALMDPCTTRTAPLGSKDVDKLMPKGKIVDVSINISSELPPAPPSTPALAMTAASPASQPAAAESAAPSSGSDIGAVPPASSALPPPSASLLASAAQHALSSELQPPQAPSTPPSRAPVEVPRSATTSAPTTLRPLGVDIGAWAPLGHGLHIHCDAGVVLHAPKHSNLKQLMGDLAAAGLDHLVIVVGLPEQASPTDFLFDGLSTFQLQMRDGTLVDGMELVMMVAEGQCPKWSVHWMVDGQPAGSGPAVGTHGMPALHLALPPGFGQGNHQGEDGQGEGEEADDGEAEGADSEDEGEGSDVGAPPAVCISFARRTKEKSYGH